MKIGDEVYVHGYVDEIRKDVVIIRNEGGYFGTVPSEMFYYEEDSNGYGTMNTADIPQSDDKDTNVPNKPQTVQKIAELQKMCGIEIDPDRMKTDCGWK